MNNVFIIKTNSDCDDFKKQLGNFLSKYCNNTDTNAAIYELNNSGAVEAQKIIDSK